MISLQDRQGVFKSQILLFLDSWNRGTSPQLQFRKVPIQKDFSFTYQTVVHLSHPLIRCEASSRSPPPSVPSFFSISWSWKPFGLSSDEPRRVWPSSPPPGRGRTLIDKERAAASLPVLGPGLEVLQGVQGGVMGAQWVWHCWFAEGLLEGGLLQLQDEAIGLLTLRFPLLGCLSPERRRKTVKKGTIMNN